MNQTNNAKLVRRVTGHKKCVKSAKIHGGLVKKVKFLFDGNGETDMNYILTAGANDGMLNVIDMRSNAPVFSKQVNLIQFIYFCLKDSPWIYKFSRY